MVIGAKFDSYCGRCRCKVKVGTMVQWTPGVRGVVHATQAQCNAARDAAAAERRSTPTVPAAVANGTPIATFIRAAKDRGLKFPKARFLAPNGHSEMTISLAPDTGKNPGAVYVKVGEDFAGMILPSGEVRGKMARDTEMLATLDAIAANPAAAAKAYGSLKCRCSFCSLPLTDAGSVEVGYGPICADKWNLPHTPKGTPRLRTVPVESVDEHNNRVIEDVLFNGPAFEEAVA